MSQNTLGKSTAFFNLVILAHVVQAVLSSASQALRGWPARGSISTAVSVKWPPGLIPPRASNLPSSHYSGSQKSKINVCWATLPPNSVGKNPSLFLPASGGLLILGYGSITPISASDFTWLSSFVSPSLKSSFPLSYVAPIIAFRANDP